MKFCFSREGGGGGGGVSYKKNINCVWGEEPLLVGGNFRRGVRISKESMVNEWKQVVSQGSLMLS